METQDIVIVVLSAMVAVSEALALIPGLKSNSILQLIINLGKKFLPKKTDGAA